MIGHKASECTVRINEVEYGAEVKDEPQVASVDIGRVWNLCQVEIANRIETSNRFGVLSEDDDDKEDFPELRIGASEFLKPKFQRIPRKRWSRIKRTNEDEEIWVQAIEDSKQEKMRMNLGFQVADVKKPLVAVKRIVEKGNLVQFGPKDEDNFIQNKSTGDKLILRQNGRGSYLMDVNFVGGSKTEITVDSGAEENVCPWDWGSQFQVRPAEKWMNFRNASGGYIDHYGARDVIVTSGF